MAVDGIFERLLHRVGLKQRCETKTAGVVGGSLSRVFGAVEQRQASDDAALRVFSFGLQRVLDDRRRAGRVDDGMDGVGDELLCERVEVLGADLSSPAHRVGLDAVLVEKVLDELALLVVQ